jgi:hypothetical protein
MDIEQLKLVLDALQGLGDGAYSAFIFWVVVQNIPWFLLFSAIVGAVYRLILKSMDDTARQSRYDTLLRELRDRLNIGSDGYITDSEFKVLSRELRRLVDAHDNT